MTNQQILTKAINKAVANGWNKPDNLEFVSKDEYIIFNIDSASGNHSDTFNTRELIYDHSFAKALWGETLIGLKVGEAFTLTSGPDGWNNEGVNEEFLTYDLHGPKWQIHLMEMVVTPDPIAYLGEHM